MSSLWTYEEFEEQDPQRAVHLRNAPPWPELVVAICQELCSSLRAGSIRFGLDESSQDSSHLRGVLQFALGRGLFDWFFNGLTGYRAQFRIGSDNGLTRNAELVAAMRAELIAVHSAPIPIHRLTWDFRHKATRTGTIGEVAVTLLPELSKAWVCDKLISSSGQIQPLFVSRTGPRLNFRDAEPWSSLYPEDAEGWLDVKGAFISPAGSYQLKSTDERARKLEERGSA